MGSGDLNMKKSWHPQRAGNVAATQKAEAEAIAERKKLQQRLQEIEEERKKEEIQKALEAAGGKRKLDRVEWMYAGPTDGQGDAAESEAYLLGKRRIDKLLQDNEIKKLSKQPSQDLITETQSIINARDVAAKLREDPLLAIKRQEQQAYEVMMNDPIKRRQLLAAMGIDDAQSKPDPKEERRHKHRHHHHRSHRHRDDGRDGERQSHRRRSDSRSRSPPRRYDSDGEERRRRRRDSPERRQQRSRSADRPSSRDRRDNDRVNRPRDSRRPGEGSRSDSPAPRRRRDYSPKRDAVSRKSYDDRNGGSYRPRRDNEQDNRPRQNGARPDNSSADQDNAAQERARKLAAMQEAATDLDKDRQLRLAAIEEAERAAREADERARQRNKKFGGDATFTNALHSRAADLKVAERMGRAQ
ncbi:pre-mRNA-splicing factor CWC25 [Podospora appendiculata]|uniref:Pre-mRNA-splicing factor CWC25 n=1 Tax=Podospora appendiculata TaxID=314037 RepID=A0AAE0XHS3_9PEZI|nr:pre-mRNA-splicing factor CWC25 [Podospora appendiculata]